MYCTQDWQVLSFLRRQRCSFSQGTCPCPCVWLPEQCVDWVSVHPSPLPLQVADSMQNRKDTPFLGLTDPGDILQESKVSLHKVKSTCVMGKRPWAEVGGGG